MYVCTHPLFTWTPLFMQICVQAHCKQKTNSSIIFRHYSPCITLLIIFLLNLSGFPTVYFDHIKSVSPISFRFTSTFLFPNFLISLLFCPNQSCLIYIAQLLLGVGPALRCGQPNKDHIVQENWFSLSQQLSHVNRFSAGQRTSWYLHISSQEL